MPDSIIKADNISSLSGEGVGFPNGSVSNPSMKFTNSSNTGLYRPSANQLGLVTNGVERLRIDNNGQVSSVIPNGSTLYNQFMCRAWVNFDGTRNVDNSGSSTNGQPVFIRGSGNISSVTKNATGDYTINFLVGMPDANYSYVAFAQDTSGGDRTRIAGGNANNQVPSTSNLRIATFGSTVATYYDLQYVFLAVFR